MFDTIEDSRCEETGVPDPVPETPVRQIRKFPSFAEREAAARARVERVVVDFIGVKPNHLDMHDRLLNWASWCRSRTAQGVAPGFGMHKSDEWDKREYGAETVVGVNKLDAAAMAKGVAHLPEKHRKTVQWYYTGRGTNPRGKAQELAVSVQGLRDHLDDARQMLVNWRV